jgi:hypothetical protein
MRRRTRGDQDLKDRDRDSLPLRAADGVLGAALAIGRHQGEHLVGRVDYPLIAGVVAPRDLALAECFDIMEIGLENFDGKAALARGLLGNVSGPLAPPDTITVSAGRPATRRSTVSRSVRRRAPGDAPAAVVANARI